MGLPNASTVAWILVLSPPRLRPMACEAPFCPSAVLVGSHDGRVNHDVLVVGVLRHRLEETLPGPVLAPAAMALMHHPEIPEPGRQIAPGDARPVAVEHGIDEQAVVPCPSAGLACTAGQQVFDALPLIVA